MLYTCTATRVTNPVDFWTHRDFALAKQRNTEEEKKKKMPVMEKLKIFVVQEPVVAASCLLAGFGLFLPAVVRPILDSFETAKEVPQPALSNVVAGMTSRKGE